MIPDLAGRTHPIARVSREALRENLRGLPRELYVDAQHDGWGHGADLVADVARELGLAGVVRGADDVVTFTGEQPASAGAVTPQLAYGLLDDGRPAMRMVGTVLGVKPLLAGEGVSYGYLHRAPADTAVALVTGGYAQGLVRSLGGVLEVSLRGERRPVVGRIAMDVCVVDVGGLLVQAGDEVVFLGDPAQDEPGLADWARITGLDPLELLLTVGLRSKREVTA